MTNLQSQIFAKEVSSCFSVEAKTREAEEAALRSFILSSGATGQNKRSRLKARLMWKNFLEWRADDLIAVEKQMRNAFTAEK
jgi:hypothetical protein